MFQVDIQRRGLDVRVVAAQLPAKIRDLLVNKVGAYAYAEMQRHAPSRTGKLRRSIRKRVHGAEVRIGPTEPYAIYVEEGTQPHEIVPVNARALRFDVGGQVVFAMHVNHPGTRPQPFVRETAEETRKRVTYFFRQLIAEMEAW
jgi:HK97 gp10 family phage protein